MSRLVTIKETVPFRKHPKTSQSFNRPCVCGLPSGLTRRPPLKTRDGTLGSYMWLAGYSLRLLSNKDEGVRSVRLLHTPAIPLL